MKDSIQNVPNNPNNQRREDIYMNDKSDTQNSNTQGYMINNCQITGNKQETSNKQQQTEIETNLMKTLTRGHITVD